MLHKINTIHKGRLLGLVAGAGLILVLLDAGLSFLVAAAYHQDLQARAAGLHTSLQRAADCAAALGDSNGELGSRTLGSAIDHAGVCTAQAQAAVTAFSSRNVLINFGPPLAGLYGRARVLHGRAQSVAARSRSVLGEYTGTLTYLSQINDLAATVREADARGGRLTDSTSAATQAGQIATARQRLTGVQARLANLRPAPGFEAAQAGLAQGVEESLAAFQAAAGRGLITSDSDPAIVALTASDTVLATTTTGQLLAAYRDAVTSQRVAMLPGQLVAILPGGQPGV